MAEQRGRGVDCRWSAGPLASALDGADVVLIQFRVGGYAGRAWDETFPLDYGVCGDEGLGPGGLACAWRTWPELRVTLETIARVNPKAFVVLLTSPIGILTRCARAAFPLLQTYGICELPWTTLGRLCAMAGVEATAATYAYLAVNHLGWFSNVRAGDRCVIPPGSVHPLKYVRLQEQRAEVLAEQRAVAPRARDLEALATDAFAIYERGSGEDVVRAVRRRETPWYAHAVAPLLRSLAGEETGVTYFLSARNDGYSSSMRADEIIEMPFRFRGGSIERCVPVPWDRADVAATVNRLVTYERLAAQAVLSGDSVELDRAIRVHPWLDGIPVTSELRADIVAPLMTLRATSTK